MSPRKRNWIVPVVLIALFFYMAVRIFSMKYRPAQGGVPHHHRLL
ncbi:MAG: hypothetical protein ACLTY5_00670 [Angelakisella sp.]